MIRTLLVDDDALTMELHRSYLARMSGFEIAGPGGGAPIAGCGRISRVRLAMRARGRLAGRVVNG